MVEYMAMSPVNTIKTHMQTLGWCPRASVGVSHALRTILQSEGPVALCRGISAIRLGARPAHAVYFTVYEVCKRQFLGQNPSNHVAHAASGVCATVASDAVFKPVDMVKQRLQLGDGSRYRGVWDCVKRVLREEGFGAFYVSYRTTVLMNAPFTAVHFTTYEAAKRGLMEVSPESADDEWLVVHATAGAAAGALEAAVTMPLDVVKTQLQCQASIHKFLETKKKNDTKEQKPENESDALTAEAVKRTPRKQLEHVFEIPLPEEPDTEDEAEIQKWKWKVNSVNQPVRWTTLLGFPVVQPYHHFGRHLPLRAIQEVVGPLQVRYFQHDFVPSNPKSKPKRYKYPEFYDPYGPRPHPSEKIVQLAERIAALSPDERAQIGPTLRYKLKHPKLQLISTEGRDLGSQGGAAAAGGVAAKVEEKKEKTAFDVKLEKFEAAAKIKVIKEVRAFTNLGLKEAKDLVEKVPVLLKQGVTKEEANDIIEKIKTAGGVAVIE